MDTVAVWARLQNVRWSTTKDTDVGDGRRSVSNNRDDPHMDGLITFWCGAITTYEKLIGRWDSERELSLRRHRTRTTKYSRLVHKFRHRSTRLCVGTHMYQSQWNNAMQRPLRRSRSFNVTDFGTNRKIIYDFLLVINTNLPPILHRF